MTATRPRRRNRRLAAALAAASLVLLGVPAIGVAGGFEGGDGNLGVDAPGSTDWASFAGSPGLTVATDRPSAMDDIFTRGTKADTEGGVITIGPVGPKKTDLLRMYAASERVGGVPRLDLAWIRNQDPGGTTALDFELNQSTRTYANGLPVRTAGDVLMVFDFQGVQTAATIAVHRWATSGACAAQGATAPCWGPGQTLAASAAIAAVNASGAVADPIGGGYLAPGTFGEASIQLWESGVLPQNECVHYGQASLKSRDGGGFVSALGDLIEPVPVNVGNCDLAIQKTAPASVTLGDTIPYTVTVSNPGDVAVPRADLHVTDPSLSAAELAFFAVVTGNADTSLEPGEAWEYRLPGGAPLTRRPQACGVVTNTAALAPLPGESTAADNSSTVATTVGGAACAPPPPPPPPPPGGLTGGPSTLPTTLRIDKWTRRGVRANRPIPFRITVTNTGTSVAQDVWISDRIPAGSALVRKPKGATVRGGFLRWRVGDLAPGQRVTVGLWLRADGNRARRLCNTARSVAGNAPRVRDTACVRVIKVAGAPVPPRVTG